MSRISVIMILGGHLIKFQGKFFFMAYWNIYRFSDAVQFAGTQNHQESGSEFSRGVCACIEEGWVGHVRGRERQKEGNLRRMIRLITFEI